MRVPRICLSLLTIHFRPAVPPTGQNCLNRCQIIFKPKFDMEWTIYCKSSSWCAECWHICIQWRKYLQNAILILDENSNPNTHRFAAILLSKMASMNIERWTSLIRLYMYIDSVLKRQWRRSWSQRKGRKKWCILSASLNSLPVLCTLLHWMNRTNW